MRPNDAAANAPEDGFAAARVPLPSAPFLSRGVALYGVAAPPDPGRLLPCRRPLPDPLRAVICCAFPYYTGPMARRNVSRYAALPDYHTVVGALLEAICADLRVLFPNERFCGYTDVSPLPEKQLAAQCGLGVLGRNTLLLTERYGSYVFLGCIACSVGFAPTGPGAAADCIGCGRCEAACPGGALAAGRLDRSRCVSALTQKKGALTAAQAALVRAGGSAWGCDRCQTVCPYNATPERTAIPAFLQDVQPVLTPENLDDLLQSRAFGYRGGEVLLRNLALLSQRHTKEEP